MPYKNPADRNFKKDYKAFKARPGAEADQKQRRAARDQYDKAGVNRAGKDIDHKKPIALGGGNKGNLRLTSVSANRSFARTSSHRPKAK